MVLNDFYLCTWPAPLNFDDDSIAAHFDGLNDAERPLVDVVAELRAAHPTAPLITFSLFVQRQELSPEKRFFFFPPFAHAIVPNFLRVRIEALQPALQPALRFQELRRWHADAYPDACLTPGTLGADELRAWGQSEE